MSVAPIPPPPDQDERDRIRTDLDATLFVEAGAGSGKTTALVDRVLSLVTTGAAELRSVAAITFTEKAAAELRDRIRQRLEQAADGAGAGDPANGLEPDPVVVERCQVAIDQLDGAAIGTLHAFAQRVLAENPIEAGLPPRVEILDEVTSDVEFERRWAGFLDRLLTDSAMERTLLLLFATGVKPAALRALAVEFDRNWDLVEDRVPGDAPDPPALRRGLDRALAKVDAGCAAVAECKDDSDKLYARLGQIVEYGERLRSMDDELDLLEELSEIGPQKPPSFKFGNIGAKGKWNCDVGAVKAEVAAAGEILSAVKGDVTQACARRIASALRAFTLEAAQLRQAAGELAFHDLLVLSRSLVTHAEHGAAVRQRLHDRYQRLLLDEFQDTDPIQIELAVRIAAADPSSVAAGDLPWNEVPVQPGQLFVVGDPKQSIYRFRRADISVFLDARHRLGAEGNLVELCTNFRTGAPIIEWANHAFGGLMAEVSDVDLPVASQPTYVDLAPVRPAPPVGPPISVIARTALAGKSNAAVMRTNEATEVAATVQRVIAEGWSVGTGAEHG
nr:UvrD-helicase domain-containing protein [Acidimicrobiia bacterium]